MESHVKKALKAAAILGVALSGQVAALQIGAWVGGSGSNPQPTQANVQAFETLQGRPLDFVQLYVIWDVNTWATTKPYADIAAADGATLLVTWMPSGYSALDIVDGKDDAYIRQFAHDIKSYPNPVWIRTLHEANGNWYSWGIGYGGTSVNTDASVASAFRHIVQIFKDSSATNVKWMWTTNATNSTGATFIGNYPGDAYVDCISIDGYNWGTSQTVAVNGWASTWQTFVQVMTPAYQAISSIDKPVVIPEFASSESGGNKAQWITDAFASLATDFPKITAMMWFNQSSDADWALTTSAAATEAWKAAVAKYPPTSSVEPRASSAAAFTSRARATGAGHLALDLAQPEPVKIAVFGTRGDLQSAWTLGTLASGVHDVDLGPGSGVRIARVEMGAWKGSVSLLPSFR
jgi:hypothetical protein